MGHHPGTWYCTSGRCCCCICSVLQMPRFPISTKTPLGRRNFKERPMKSSWPSMASHKELPVGSVFIKLGVEKRNISFYKTHKNGNFRECITNMLCCDAQEIFLSWERHGRLMKWSVGMSFCMKHGPEILENLIENTI